MCARKNSENKRLLITGHRGYIGSVMAPYFVERGFDVVGLDTEYFGEACTFVSDPKPIPSIKKDLRDVTGKDLDGFDAVIHLAAICNDPLGNLNAAWTHEINHAASVQLATLAKKAEVRRFLFSSSCSMHGANVSAKVSESTPVHPLTPYGESKIKAEQDISRLSDDDFSPTFLRNGTVYGVSPRLRLDIVLNNLVGWAVTIGKIRMMTDGSPWRPVIHVQDVCQAFWRVLESTRESVHNEAFHVGCNRENFQIRKLAEVVKSVVPGCQIEYANEPSADKRTYIADFTKIETTIKTFKPEWDVLAGAKELYSAYREQKLTVQEMTGVRFVRLNRMAQLLEEKKLDTTLRWRKNL